MSYSRKPAPKQKTYGKAVRAHNAGTWGRNLWTADIEAETVARMRAEQETKLAAAMAARERRKQEEKRKRANDDAAEDTGARQLETSRPVQPLTELDKIADEMLKLSLSMKPELHTEISIFEGNGGRGSPAISIKDYCSDKENERSPSPNYVDVQTKSFAELQDTQGADFPARSVLGEKNMPEIESLPQSPPRKHGLRKRLSSASCQSPTAAAPAPLRREVRSAEDMTAFFEDPIQVWDDDLQDAVVLRKKPSMSVWIPDPEGADDAQGEGETRPSSPDPAAIRSAKSSPVKKETTDSIRLPPDDSDLTDSSNEEDTYYEPTTDDLLRQCSEDKILEFESHIESVLECSTIEKLGEASYSEVFLQTNDDFGGAIVLKVIPFGKEGQCEIRSIIQEVRITKSMGEIDGYIGFRGAYVVRGPWPEDLMDEWDAYDEEYGSENQRPDFYEADQLFAIIKLENGGTDLEHTELANWEEACDIFWQVARALSTGEKERQFEHRDLHFGNVVLRRIEHSPEDLFLNLSLDGSTRRPSSFKVALIDYTLSRGQCGDAIEFAPLDDPALFTAKGNYQFDIYRFMRSHIGGDADDDIDWNVFAPQTNIFWLHYLTVVLLRKMGLTKPAARGRYAASEREIEAWRILDAVSKRIDPRKKRFGDAEDENIGSAQELMEWAAHEGFEI